MQVPLQNPAQKLLVKHLMALLQNPGKINNIIIGLTKINYHYSWSYKNKPIDVTGCSQFYLRRY